MTFLKAPSIALFASSNPQQRHYQPSAITRLQSTATTVIAPVEPTFVPKSKYEDLLDWLKSNNAEINSKIVIQESTRGGGYGAFVSDDVTEGEVLFTIPRQACVTLDNIKADAKCGKAFEEVMKKAGPGGNTVVMAGFLAKEYLISQLDDQNDESSSSSFGPYLKTLPWERGINSQEHVLFWDKSALETTLEGSFCYNEAMELCNEVDLATKIIKGIVGPSIRVARGEIKDGFAWPWEKVDMPLPTDPIQGLPEAVKGAFVSLLTRGFEDGDQDAEKLVPLLDMLQHCDEPNIRHVMQKADGTVEVRARRDIAAGDELLNQYRSEEEENMPYHRFFTRFGFVPGILEPTENLLADKSSIFYPKVEEV